MAEIYENSLPSKTNIATNDLIRLIGSNNASYKALVSDVAKCIVENYAGSNIAGSSQSIKAALDTLNSRLWKHIEMGDHRTLTLHFTTGFVSLFVYGTGSGMTPFMAAITASPDESSILVNPTTRNITVSGNRSSVVVTFPASWYNTWFSSDYEFTYEIS